mgnify:CR=1 FL=1
MQLAGERDSVLCVQGGNYLGQADAEPCELSLRYLYMDLLLLEAEQLNFGHIGYLQQLLTYQFGVIAQFGR